MEGLGAMPCLRVGSFQERCQGVECTFHTLAMRAREKRPAECAPLAGDKGRDCANRRRRQEQCTEPLELLDVRGVERVLLGWRDDQCVCHCLTVLLEKLQ